jgi:hypothetical protein
MKELSIEQMEAIKRKLNISIVTLGLFCLSLFSFNQSNSQTLAEIADAAEKVGDFIQDSCDKNRPAEGFKVCKGDACVSGKCISFRTRCEGMDPNECK